MDYIKSDPAGYLSHDVRNRINIVRGYAELSGEEDQMKAGEEFERFYERFERVLWETGNFDEEILAQMRDLEPLRDEKVRRNAESTLYSIDSVKSLFNSGKDKTELSGLLEPVSSYGAVDYEEEIADLEIDASYQAIISTKISDHLKHALEVDVDSEMFADARIEEGGLRLFIGDTGPGVEKEDLEKQGKGSEIIDQALAGKGSRFATYTNDRVEKMELEDLPHSEEEIGALFELHIPEVLERDL